MRLKQKNETLFQVLYLKQKNLVMIVLKLMVRNIQLKKQEISLMVERVKLLVCIQISKNKEK
jgi:hypothetical protein